MTWWKHKEAGIKSFLRGDLSSIDVAIVDSGIDATHPALYQRVSSAVRVEPQHKGYRIVRQQSSANHDAFNHGTAVAGIVAQVAPNANIHDIRIFDCANNGCGATNVEGFRYAIEQGYPIINLAIVCNANHAPALQQLCEEAHRRNIVVVAAIRNVAKPDLGFPAAFSSCISVGSDTFESVYDYRYTGPTHADFVAFGRGLNAPAPDNSYACSDGTSFAAAVVSGLCAIIRGAYPSLPVFEVKTVLKVFASQA